MHYTILKFENTSLKRIFDFWWSVAGWFHQKEAFSVIKRENNATIGVSRVIDRQHVHMLVARCRLKLRCRQLARRS